MKKLVGRNTRLIRRAAWLIRLRWYAVILVILIFVFCKLYLLINLDCFNILLIAILLVLENMLCHFHLKMTRFIKEKDKKFNYAKRNINYQISFDLILLSVLVHLTGGIESPFIPAFYFHMVIASILLSQKETFFQTTFAVIILSTITYLEYKHILDHYCVCFSRFKSPNPNLFSDAFNYIKTLSSFIISFYILVYISSTMGKRLRNQEELYRKAISLLNKKDKYKNEYVIRVTHDIKGHVSAIQTSLSVVKTGIFAKLNPKNQEFIDRAYKRTYALIKFIKDLLRLTKMRLSEEFESEVFSLKNTLINAFNDALINAENKSIKMHIHVDDLINEFKGDELSIKEITTNLILNAVKYTPINGEIFFKATDNRDHIRVEISDNGIGIPEKDMPNIFEEFFRGSNVEKNKIEGTGVGLAIAKNVIKNHKGEIWAESIEGEGSTFIYTLPK